MILVYRAPKSGLITPHTLGDFLDRHKRKCGHLDTYDHGCMACRDREDLIAAVEISGAAMVYGKQ